jgi:hypothetical protein
LSAGPVSSQAGGQHTTATAARATHQAQHFAHGSLLEERGQIGDGERALATAACGAAINGQVEAGELVQGTGQDGCSLSTG